MHILRLSILNQRKRKQKYVAGPGIEPGTSSSWIRRATDCATLSALTHQWINTGNKQITDKTYDESEVRTWQKQCIATPRDPRGVKHHWNSLLQKTHQLSLEWPGKWQDYVQPQPTKIASYLVHQWVWCTTCLLQQGRAIEGKHIHCYV